MPHNPTPSTALTRPDLAATFNQFDLEASRQGFVGLEIFPVFESNKQSASFKRRKLESLLKEAETRRASGGDYKRTNWDFDEDNFATEDHGIEETVDDRDSTIYADYFDAEAESAEQARDIVLRNFEKRIIDMVTDTTLMPDGAVANGAWNVPGTATPLTDTRTAMLTIYQACGLIPDTGVVSWERWLFLKDNNEVNDKIKHAARDDVRSGNVSVAQVAESMGLRRLLVAGAQRNTANEAVAASLSPLWPNNRVLLYVSAPQGAALQKPCLGRTIHWGEDGSRLGGLFETYRPEGARYQVVRCRQDTDEKLMFDKAGFVITGT